MSKGTPHTPRFGERSLCIPTRSEVDVDLDDNFTHLFV